MFARFACLLVGKADVFIQGFETGLAQQQCALALRWPLYRQFGIDAALGHQALYRVYVQRARGQMVDVWAFERHHIGNQAVLVGQGLVLGGAHRGLMVPTEGFQGGFDKAVCIGIVQAALCFAQGYQAQGFVGENAAFGQNRRGTFAQFGVFYQFQTQQRAKHPKRAHAHRFRRDGSKRRGMHRHARRRQIVIRNRMHAHHGKQAAYGGQFFCRAHSYRAMALQIQARQFLAVRQSRGFIRVFFQEIRIDLGHQID